MSAKKVRIGLIGTGRIGQVHAATVAASTNAELTWVCDVFVEGAEKTAAQYGGKVTSDPAVVFASGEVDAVIVASPTSTHVDLISQAIDAGVHVLCEKPIDLDITRVDALRAKAAAATIKIALGFNRRFDPNFSALKTALDKGEKLRAIYDIYPQNVFNVVSLKSQNILKPADLKGKRIGVYSLSSGTRQNLQVLLHQAGLTEADVTVVVTGLLNFAPLMQGQVDATAATDTGLLIGRQKGLGGVNVMEIKNHLNISSDLFVVREDTYQQKKEVLKRFLKAYQDCAKWMMQSPDEAAKLAVKYAIDGQNVSMNLDIIRLRNESSVSTTTDKRGLGAFDMGSLQKGAVAYKAFGVIQRDIKISDVVSQDLLPNKPSQKK